MINNTHNKQYHTILYAIIQRRAGQTVIKGQH